MFAKAYKIACEYTFPALVSYRFFDGTIESGLGTFVVINEEGWIITAAHILQSGMLQQQHLAAINKYNEEVSYISKNDRLDPKEQERRIKKLNPDKKWIINHSFWWGADHHRISNFNVLKENDIAIGRIENYDPGFVKTYPVFKDPAALDHGTSLCKLGHPFYDVKASFDIEKNSFFFDPSTFPIPRFPIDGMFTRDINAGKSADGKYDIKFIETSTPGLKGQSGGPTFDREGRIWAIQSQTNHLPLGFAPKLKMAGREVQENQFLNVGWGAHVETILRFLNDNGVSYKIG